jgi:hypothetical protein
MTGYRRYIGLAFMTLGSALQVFLLLVSARSQGIFGVLPAIGAFGALVLFTCALKLETDDLHKRVLGLEAELERRDQPQPPDDGGGHFFGPDA